MKRGRKEVVLSFQPKAQRKFAAREDQHGDFHSVAVKGLAVGVTVFSASNVRGSSDLDTRVSSGVTFEMVRVMSPCRHGQARDAVKL